MDARNAEIVVNNNCQSLAIHLHPYKRINVMRKSKAI